MIFKSKTHFTLGHVLTTSNRVLDNLGEHYQELVDRRNNAA
jgi:hypothetical protein